MSADIPDPLANGDNTMTGNEAMGAPTPVANTPVTDETIVPADAAPAAVADAAPAPAPAPETLLSDPIDIANAVSVAIGTTPAVASTPVTDAPVDAPVTSAPLETVAPAVVDPIVAPITPVIGPISAPNETLALQSDPIVTAPASAPTSAPAPVAPPAVAAAVPPAPVAPTIFCGDTTINDAVMPLFTKLFGNLDAFAKQVCARMNEQDSWSARRYQAVLDALSAAKLDYQTLISSTRLELLGLIRGLPTTEEIKNAVEGELRQQVIDLVTAAMKDQLALITGIDKDALALLQQVQDMLKNNPDLAKISAIVADIASLQARVKVIEDNYVSKEQVNCAIVNGVKTAFQSAIDAMPDWGTQLNNCYIGPSN